MNAIVPVSPAPPAFGYSDLERMAKAIAASKLFGIATPDQAMALMLLAQAEGMHPATAARDYHLISGRPAKKADAMLRDFLSAGGKVEWHTLSDETVDATFSHPAGGSARIDWTLKRAQAAGIANPMWKKYPRQMLRSRVVSEGVRTVCPGATSGMYVPEEVQDIVHAEPRGQASDRGPDPQAEEVDIAQDAEFAPIVTRKSSAQAKRDGDHIRINAMIDGADATKLDDMVATFDEWTADQPLGWLDPLLNRIELRREELTSPVAEDEAALDAEFRSVVGGPASAVAGRGNDRAAA